MTLVALRAYGEAMAEEEDGAKTLSPRLSRKTASGELPREGPKKGERAARARETDARVERPAMGTGPRTKTGGRGLGVERGRGGRLVSIARRRKRETTRALRVSFRELRPFVYRHALFARKENHSIPSFNA